jgi:hypothetical protein
VCFVSILCLSASTVNLDLDSQNTSSSRGIIFFSNLFRNITYAKEQMWPSTAIVFPNPEGRDSPICDDDAGVHGHHLQFLLLHAFIIRTVADSYTTSEKYYKSVIC